ncbi:MAG: amidohydrolase family protein [Chloroflexi bacterium]|nr:amidohydrolase family protein [Chloroflexota bacterium]
MPHDLLIKNGTVIDGSGAPAFRADVAVRAGKVAAVGRIGGAADETIDAEGLVVSPGFIDMHTHYDAQLCWDPLATSSSWHGVTTVVTGNCGYGIAPTTESGRAYTAALMAHVEGISLDVLNAGVDWDWETFGDFLRPLCPRVPALEYGRRVCQ